MTTKASPETGTIKQVAWCKHCAEMVEKTSISKGWYHVETGNRECS